MNNTTPAKLLWVGRSSLYWDQDYEDILALHQALSYGPDRDALVRCVISRIGEDRDRKARKSVEYWTAQARNLGEAGP